MHNRLVTNLYNSLLLGVFAYPELELVSQLLRSRNKNAILTEYIERQTFGLSRGGFSLEKGLQPNAHGSRAVALLVNEGKKQALRRMHVR